MNDIYLEWLNEQVGCWNSSRIYYYILNNSSGIPEIRRRDTIITISKEDTNDFLVTWVSNKTKGLASITIGDGEMLLTYDKSNHTLHRSRGYFTSSPTTSLMVPNDNGMTLYTEYDGVSYVERMHNLSDKIRTRQSVQTKNYEVNLVGQYIEIRYDPQSMSGVIKTAA